MGRIVAFLKRFPLDQLLVVLRATEADDIVRLVEHTNVRVAAKAFDLNLDVVFVAGYLGSALASPSVAYAVYGTTEVLGSGVETVGLVMDSGQEVADTAAEAVYLALCNSGL